LASRWSSPSRNYRPGENLCHFLPENFKPENVNAAKAGDVLAQLPTVS